MNKNVLTRAITNALAMTAYVVAVGVFMFNANRIFGPEDNFFSPVVAMMLLVLSAAVAASLLFGLPVMWYLDGKKKEALYLLAATLACFAIATILAMICLAVL